MKIQMVFFLIYVLSLFVPHPSEAIVLLGVDRFFAENGGKEKLQGKRVALVTNHTGMDSTLISTANRLLEHAKNYKVVAFFSPEHGWRGDQYASEKGTDHQQKDNIPIYTLHGKRYRPSSEVLASIDVIIYDIQSIGVRSYTYESTLFYVMEEAAKHQVEVIVLDRPNPINGVLVDGLPVEEEYRSPIGYIHIPYCHGMTIGELAQFFNQEYAIGCSLTIIPMEGWKRSMTFTDTSLPWIPTSPHIPESSTPLFYACTGILGEMGIHVGVGYTLPFKVVGAPWIDADQFAQKLNEQKFPGVSFLPFHYRPFYGSHAKQECHGVLIQITDLATYRPIRVQYLLLGILKTLYPAQMQKQLLSLTKAQKGTFFRSCGTKEIYRLLTEEKFATWKMLSLKVEERLSFSKKRKKYLLPSYK